jgi:putative Mn2+ efflux pump MntP
MLEVLFVAVAVGLGNFAAAIGIGISGVDSRTRLRVGLVFGTFEAGMPLVGILLGRQVSGLLGSKASIIGGGLLIATGLFGLIQARRNKDEPDSTGLPTRRLIIVGAALSVDNLIVGLALGASSTSIVEAVITIAVVSVAMTLLGLELGSRLGSRVGEWSGEIGAGVLVAVGIAIICGLH